MSGPSSLSAFSQTLHTITQLKLTELEKQRVAYHEHAQKLHETESLDRDSIERLEQLLQAVRSAPSAGAASSGLRVAGGINLANLDNWIEQAKIDPSVSPSQIGAWSDALEAHIRRGTASFDYAKLFGQLFTEWLASQDSRAQESASETTGSADGVQMDEDFQEVGRKELHEQREQYEARVFSEGKTVDTTPFKKYLEDLFASDRESMLTLTQMRLNIKAFAENLTVQRLNVYVLKQTINNLLKQDLLNNEKRATLSEFAQNNTILEEVASVLNMHLSRIGSWTWPEDGVQMEMRRALNGKYRFFLDEEIILAIFVHHLGLQWSIKFKSELSEFLSRGWKSTLPFQTAKEHDRWHQFIGATTDKSIEAERREYQRDVAFLGQLPTNINESSGYDDSGDADAPQATSAKQRLLDQLNVEMLVGKTIHGGFTVVLSDFEWFGPSLDFGILLTVMEFFGVPDDWLAFFRTFLEAPLKFKGDPKDVRARKRVRGTPVGHSLSTLFGEALLFVMDYAVNQRADGLFLYRIHDDLWLWDHDASRVARGWSEMQIFAQLAGLTFNKEKTGSVIIGHKQTANLPEGTVRWGFLKLDAQEAKFIVDDASVTTHIFELRRQLQSAESVFGVVNRFNFYIRFITRNLGGRPSQSFGQDHVTAMIKAISRVQQEVFEGDDVLGYLKSMVAKRFGITDAPLGWFFIPNGLGGLGLLNPLVELFAIKTNMPRDPVSSLRAIMDGEEDTHRRAKETYDTQVGRMNRKHRQEWDFSFEEYIAGRENASAEWATAYISLLSYASPHEIASTPEVDAAIAVLQQTAAGTFNQYTNFSSLGFYDKWNMTLYCSELTRTFGSFAIVDPALIPVGMLEVFRGTKVRWEQ